MSDPDHDPIPFQEFSDFVAERKQIYTGGDVSENTSHYVPRSVLRDYWTPNKVSKVLRAYKPALSASIPSIRGEYIRIFSTLVYIEKVNHLHKFTRHSLDDSKLPLSSLPSGWSDTPHYRDLFNLFTSEQWVFCPLYFKRHLLDDRQLDGQYILPIEQFDMIQSGDLAMVQKIVISDEYNYLVERENDCPSKRVFGLKTYHNKKSEAQYENERKALTMLMNIPSDNIITYHGSFRQNGTYNLILDYADGGSLKDLLGKRVPPSTTDAIEQFWRSLFDVLKGLQSIHQWMEPGDDSPIRGIHEDIKPDNILLFMGRSGSPYDFTPKVADFGLFSHVRQSKASSSEAMGLDNHGNQRYSSPECSHNTARMSKGPNWITSKADIFSLGALFSDCAAWIAGGRELQAKYLKKRLSYHTTNNTFQRNGYDGCFHDGIDPLPIIEDFHKEIRRLCQPHDSITPGVVDIVQSHMLLGKPVDRLNPQKLLVKFVQLLPSSKLVLDPTGPIAIHWESALPSSAVASAALPPQGAADAGPADADIDDLDMASSGTARGGANRTCPRLRITLCEVDPELAVESGQFKDSGCGSSQASNTQEPHENETETVGRRTSKSYSALDGRVGLLTVEGLGRYRTAIKSRQDPDPLAQEVVDFILHNLAGRDQFFFIDDSRSMKDHTLVVNQTFLSLSWLTKRLDPDKLELSFASAPTEIFKAKKTKKLSKRVSEQQYHRDPTLMESSFGHLVDDVLIPRLPCKFFGLNLNPRARRRMSVYIFTDGNWGDVPGVERPLRRLMKKMQERDLDRSQVSLHFIRFGSHASGQNYLHFLDELGRHEKWDIVDVKDVSHPVTDILIGPMSADVDNRVYDS